MHAKFWAIIIIAFITKPLAAQSNIILFPADTPQAPCSILTIEQKDEILLFINQIPESMVGNYGEIVKDSALGQRRILIQMLENGTFFKSTTTKNWTPEPYPTISAKLNALLENSTTQADSINTLCHWIAKRYPFGEPDPDPAFEQRSLDSTWTLLNHGNVYGLCGEMTSFFSKIVHTYYPGWGSPIQFSSFADTSLTRGGTGSPSHVWVGLSKENGKIWAVCDPTLGGLVKDSETDTPLTLDEVILFLQNKADCWRLKIDKEGPSFQVYGEGCIPALLLKKPEAPLYYYASSSGIVEGEWKGLDDSPSLSIPYWHSKKLPRDTFMNVYLDIRDIWSNSTGSEQLVKSIKQAYLAP